MFLSAIAAMSENRVIGADNKLPWHLPADLHHFKKLTEGHPVLMGRHTYESIGHPLPNRCNIIITKDYTFNAPGCVVANSIDCALDSAAYSEHVFLIGGASLYEHLMPKVKRIYLTIVHHHFNGDKYFPELNMAEWEEVSRERHEADEKNPYAYSFIQLDRKKR